MEERTLPEITGYRLPYMDCVFNVLNETEDVHTCAWFIKAFFAEENMYHGILGSI